jgi:hypothetical protein
MKSKKSQLAYVIDIVIIIAMTYVLLKGYQISGVQANIGSTQLQLTRGFAEGEQIREYLKGGMRLAIYEQLDDRCSADFILDMEDFGDRMTDYVSNYNSPYGFEIEFPNYIYRFENRGSYFNIIGEANKNILIKSRRFNYEISGEIKEVITCESSNAFSVL